MGKSLEENLADMKEAELLLKEFGADLVGYDPGVSAVVPPPPGKYSDDTHYWTYSKNLNFDGFHWAWIKPLLQELLEFRRNAKKD